MQERIDITEDKSGGVIYVDEVPHEEGPEMESFAKEAWISAGAACLIIACSFIVFNLFAGTLVVQLSK